jgi:hypothetical protein
VKSIFIYLFLITLIVFSGRLFALKQPLVFLGDAAQYYFSVDPAYVGHGIQKKGSLKHEEITALKKKYANNPILKKAFDIMEGADLAVAHDVASFLAHIKKNPQPSRANLDELYRIMERDKEVITSAASCFEKGKDPEKVWRPFLDLLHILGSQGEVEKYKGQHGIAHAIDILKKHEKELIRGEIPQELKNAPSRVAIDLRIALFYLDRMAALEKRSFKTLNTFCPASYFGNAKQLEEALKETSFYENGVFYAPSNGYIKNADVCLVIRLDQLGEREPTDSQLKMVFADCSGFGQYVARAFHPQNERLQKERLMSYHMAPLYDALANEKMGTKDKMYSINGNTRELSINEKDLIKKYSVTIKNLKDVYEAIINPLENIKPGDLIIERGASEGHLMIAVEQDPNNKSKIAVVELTSFGGTGYNWTYEMLKSGSDKEISHRVLRIKQ